MLIADALEGTVGHTSRKDTKVEVGHVIKQTGQQDTSLSRTLSHPGRSG